LSCELCTFQGSSGELLPGGGFTSGKTVYHVINVLSNPYSARRFDCIKIPFIPYLLYRGKKEHFHFYLVAFGMPAKYCNSYPPHISPVRNTSLRRCDRGKSFFYLYSDRRKKEYILSRYRFFLPSSKSCCHGIIYGMISYKERNQASIVAISFLGSAWRRGK